MEKCMYNYYVLHEKKILHQVFQKTSLGTKFAAKARRKTSLGPKKFALFFVT